MQNGIGKIEPVCIPAPEHGDKSAVQKSPARSTLAIQEAYKQSQKSVPRPLPPSKPVKTKSLSCDWGGSERQGVEGAGKNLAYIASINYLDLMSQNHKGELKTLINLMLCLTDFIDFSLYLFHAPQGQRTNASLMNLGASLTAQPWRH